MESAEEEAATNNEVELSGLSRALAHYISECPAGVGLTLEAFGHHAEAACRLLPNTRLQCYDLLIQSMTQL